MKFFALALLLIVTGQALTAQEKVSGTLKGKVVDQINNLPLPDATITILEKVDTTAVGFSVADKTGSFEIRNIPGGSYMLQISFTGYAPHTRNISITAAKPNLDLDTIKLNTDTSMLTAVIVTVPPITIKKDTVEFRAAAFKTKVNATVEDLLKKLPGVEVDKDGNITSQGEDIPKIYVDGKEFFGNDPKIATKNLTAEMVESIQVYDDMSDQAKFTKIDDGSRQRTINIKLKKNRRKGLFGRSTVGGGSSERYTGNLSVNSFNEDMRISLVASANNVNRLGFTSNDVVSGMGGMGGFSGRGGGGGGRGGRGGGGGGSAGNGNTKSWSAGVNYSDNWGPKVLFSGNYFASNNNNISRSTSHRTNFFKNDSTSIVDEQSYTMNNTTNHRFGMRFEYVIDTMNKILITPNVVIQRSNSESFDSSTTISSSPNAVYKAIEGSSGRSNERNGFTLNNNLLFMHRFKKPGRSFTIGWNTSVNDGDGVGVNTSPYRYYNSDSTLNRFNNQRQQSEQETGSFNNTISTSLTEMFGTDKILELNYAYSNNKSTSDREVRDYVDGKGYDSINKNQTNYFENTFISSRIGTNFRVKKTKYDWQLGGAVQFATLENLSRRAMFNNKDSIMSQSYVNFFPNANFNYNMGTRQSLRFGYRGSTRAPSISQLQDVVDESNQQVFRTGNPNLKQEFTNNFNFSLNTFKMSNFMFFNVNINATVISNRIVSSQSEIAGKPGVQLIRPVNLNGAWDMSLSGTLGLPLIKVTTGKRSPMNINLTSSVRYGKDVVLQNDQKGFNTTTSLGERARFDYNIDDKLDLGASANLNFNDAKYDLANNSTANNNNKYFNHSYSLDVTYTFYKNFMLSSDFDYMVNSGRAAGYNQPIPLLNSSIAWIMFKKRNGELRFSVYDVFNQNKNINRSISPLYIEDTYTQTLRRFVMLTFMYSFNRFGGRQPGQRGGGGGDRQFGGQRGGGGGGNRGGGGGGRF